MSLLAGYPPLGDEGVEALVERVAGRFTAPATALFPFALCPRVVVDSQNHPWLDHEKKPMPMKKFLKKPDLFTTYLPFVSRTVEAASASDGGSGRSSWQRRWRPSRSGCTGWRSRWRAPPLARQSPTARAASAAPSHLRSFNFVVA
jgi:hypothetical protein